MATDFAYAAFFLPVLICIGIALLLAMGTVQTGGALLGLGRVRLARGYLGALLATFIFAVVTATDLGFGKVELGHITQDELRGLLPGYILYFFVLTTPFVLAALTVIGLPVLAALRRLKAMTVIWTVGGAILFSLAIGLWTLVSPYNQWCATHLAMCGAKSALGAAYLAVPVVVAFSLAARIPFRRIRDAA